MIAEKISIEELITALKTKSFEDQMKVVAALSATILERLSTQKGTSKYPLAPDNIDSLEEPLPEVDEKVIPTVKNTQSILRKESGEGSKSLDSLFGAWKDIDKGWEKPIEEVIKESRNWTKEPIDYDAL